MGECIIWAMDQDERARYTRGIKGQEARNLAEMKRPYYVAGEKIDGGVIQHYPGTEILVVDFEKDVHLKEFYESSMQRYQKLSWIEKLQISLPAFLQAEVQKSVVYNLKISDAICDGNLGLLMRDSVWLGKLNPTISRRGLSEIAKVGALADRKIEVGTYLRIGAGVCRQQGVILAACMERAIASGRAPGWKGVEIRANRDLPGGHLWAVVKDDRGNEPVFDPAQRYYGPAKRGGGIIFWDTRSINLGFRIRLQAERKRVGPRVNARGPEARLGAAVISWRRS